MHSVFFLSNNHEILRTFVGGENKFVSLDRIALIRRYLIDIAGLLCQCYQRLTVISRACIGDAVICVSRRDCFVIPLSQRPFCWVDWTHRVPHEWLHPQHGGRVRAVSMDDHSATWTAHQHHPLQLSDIDLIFFVIVIVVVGVQRWHSGRWSIDGSWFMCRRVRRRQGGSARRWGTQYGDGRLQVTFASTVTCLHFAYQLCSRHPRQRQRQRRWWTDSSFSCQRQLQICTQIWRYVTVRPNLTLTLTLRYVTVRPNLTITLTIRYVTVRPNLTITLTIRYVTVRPNLT